MTTTSRRRRRVNPYLQLDKRVARDDTMSFRALGVLTRALAAPPKALINVHTLSAPEGREGREAVAAAMRELGAHGHYRVERRQGKGGKFVTGTSWSELPVPHWKRDYADYDGKPVPLVAQPDGTFLVKRPDGTLVPEEYDDTSVWVEDDVEDDSAEDDEDGISAGQAADGFPVAGKPSTVTPRGSANSDIEGQPDVFAGQAADGLPAAGEPCSGKPSAKEENFGSSSKNENQTPNPPPAPRPATEDDVVDAEIEPDDVPADRVPHAGPPVQLGLDGEPIYTAETYPADVEVRPEVIGQLNDLMIQRYLEAWKAAAGGVAKVPDVQSVINGLQRLMRKAFQEGYTRREVGKTLQLVMTRSRGALPSKPIWAACLTEAAGGRDPGDNVRQLRPGGSNLHVGGQSQAEKEAESAAAFG